MPLNFHHSPIRRPWWSFSLLAGVLMAGCQESDLTDETPPDYLNVVPVTGTVTANGQPLAAAVVTFLPEKWSASNGETDESGVFELETAGKPGVPPGPYKVCISYLVSAEGEPQGLGPRSAISPPPGMATAREKLPPEYSDFGRTTLKRTVPAGGANFDFDIPLDLVRQPKPTELEPSKAESQPNKASPTAS
jgi:hypothetical protein